MLLEKTQRRLCRTLFVLGCVLPTLAVAGFTSGRLRPAYVDDLLQAVGDRLGASIACESLSTPRPGVYELRQATLSSAADGRDFVTCDALRVTIDHDGVHFAAKTVSVRRPADAWVLRLLESSNLKAEGQIATLLIEGTQQLDKVIVSIDGANASASCATGDAITARLDANACVVELKAPTCAIPVEWLPCGALRGATAETRRFTGVMSATVPVDGGPVRGEASGRLELKAITLDGLKAERGSVQKLELAWLGERIQRFAGRVELRDGQLARPIVWGMCRWLAMEPFAALEARWSEASGDCWFDYTQLACDVELDESGLVIVAGCGEIDGQTRSGAVAHAVVEHQGEALLKQPELRPLPVQRLVQAWRPDDPAELPATPGAVEMLNWLPRLAPQ